MNTVLYLITYMYVLQYVSRYLRLLNPKQILDNCSGLCEAGIMMSS